MKSITYSTAREQLAATMEGVCREGDVCLITRKNRPPVVMMSLEEFERMEETANLLRSPANATRLLASIHELETGRGKVRKIPAPE